MARNDKVKARNDEAHVRNGKGKARNEHFSCHPVAQFVILYSLFVIPDSAVVIPDLIRDPVPRRHWIADQVRNDSRCLQ